MSLSANKIIFTILLSFMINVCNAAKLKGKVSDEENEALPFASVYIKGTTKGTTTNIDGFYSYELAAGTYTIVCQYVGYEKQEIEINLKEENLTKDFKLKSRGKELKQVVIKKGEDPALRIIRKTIKKRSFYNKEIDAFKANAYIKGSIKMNEINASKMMMSMMGMSGKDSASQADRKELENSKGILMLSESYNEIAYKRPDKLKIKVKSSRVSGKQGAYGFSDPIFVNMYDNNVSMGEQLSPRGFISPIAETAMLNYKYELQDTYQEDGKTISIIKVIPRRLYEPLFEGTLHIIENEWRLYSVDLRVDKLHQLEILDTISIKQIYVPVKNTFMVKDQSFKMSFGLMGFSFSGNFVNVFTDYVFDYDTKTAFDKFEKEFDKDALTQKKAYWDQQRPVPLDTAEANDYIKKDSIELAEKAMKDTAKPIHEKNSFKSVITKGYRKGFKKEWHLHTSPIISVNTLLRQVNWNTAEGFNYTYGFYFKKTINKDRKFYGNLKTRYGFSNRQFNAKLSGNYDFGKTNKVSLRLSGGRYVFQYNNEEPVSPLLNSFYTLLYGCNYLKIYQAWCGKLSVIDKMVNGFSFSTHLSYQDRMPLSNTNDFSFQKAEKKQFTANYPVEQISSPEPRHQAFIATVAASYQLGRKYIKYPDRIESQASRYPTIQAEYTMGLPVLGSDLDYNRWKLGIDDELHLNLWGTLMYNASVGGFIRKEKVFTTDYTHFNGNQIILASPYLNSFQLSSYYANSNTESFYTTLHAEHHFYGLLTNKIPLFRKLKYYLVAAGNAYYVDQNNNYIEFSGGLENIGYKLLRIVRVDAVVGYSNLKNPVFGIRIGINGGAIQFGTKDE